jgi:anti-anti-sigma regulatory factor
MVISLKLAPLRVLSLVGATRRARGPIPPIPPSRGAPVARPAGELLQGGPRPTLASSAQSALMCWWIDEIKSGTRSADPVLAVQLDLYERRISLRGRIDDENVGTLVDVTTTLIALNPGDSTVDISGVSHIGAAGIACVANLGNELAAIGAELKVLGAGARQRRRFGIGSLSRLREAA